MENIIEIGGVVAITIIVYLVAEFLKATSLDTKWLAPICGAVGGALGIVGMYIMPDFPASDAITAIAVGVVSGLAATGAYETFKAFRKNVKGE